MPCPGGIGAKDTCP